MIKRYKGIWLYGKSGSGKTFISKKIFKQLKNSFIIDGDEVRSKISFDLKYTVRDRIIQNKRVLGLAKIVISNNFFPIISSVYLDKNITKTIKKNKIKIVEVISSSVNVNKKLYKKKNVVGKSINQPKIMSNIYINKFNKDLRIKSILK